MSHKPINVLEDSSNPIVAEIDGVVYFLAAMSAQSYPSKADDFSSLAKLVSSYKDKPTVLMGDLNAISPLDKPRYNESLLCGNGTYNPDDQSGEVRRSDERSDELTTQSQVAKTTNTYFRTRRASSLTNAIIPTLHPNPFRDSLRYSQYVINFCLEDEGGKWGLDFTPMERLMNETDLVDLCYYGGGFYDVDDDGLISISQCAFSNPTLLIHMTGDYDFDDLGSHAHTHAMAKIDYVLANQKMLEEHRFHHSTVLRTLQNDGASDHYPIEATFL